jgi:hypothetical protein
MKKRNKLAMLAGAGTLVACSIATSPAYAALTTLTAEDQTVPSQSVSDFPTGVLQTTLNSGSVTSLDGDVTGTLVTSVYSGGDGALGTGLTFVYLVTQTGSVDGNSIDELKVPGWSDGAEVGYYNPGTSSHVTPINGELSTGGVLNFQWGGFADGSTLELIVETPETSWGGVSATLDNSAPAYPVSALAPVPEPTTMIAGAFLLLPIGASTLRALRKNRAA